mmetsp:Transcript_92313/g.238265  ORF Transcript_92313/g.238265 Transcript_92313/m.238265 type:complete len:1117 (+) Transcript_92313:3-3353(+)
MSIPQGLLPKGVVDALKSQQVSKLKDKWDDGDFHTGMSTNGSVHTANKVLNLGPKRISNFGWNWDFNMNTTEQPELNFTVPGATGSFVVRNPYIRAHAGFYMEVSSQLVSVDAVPTVSWVAGIRGHGTVQARIMATQKTSAPEAVNLFQKFHLPFLGEFGDAKWFGKLDFAAANLPISIEPGFQFRAEMYHDGAFDGSLAVGGRTHGIIEPSLSFDSVKGLDEHFTGHLKDTELWPPVYIVFTDHFELGVSLLPKLLLRSDMGGFQEMTWAMEMKDYMNFTVSRDENAPGDGDENQFETRTLTAYPYRVTGVTSAELHKRYKVQISIGQESRETKPAINWGSVEVRDHVSNFDFGEMTVQDVNQRAISVTLIEVDSMARSETSLGSGIVFCRSIAHSECNHATVAQIKSREGVSVATVDMAIVWNDQPEAWFATKIRGAAVSFTQVDIQGSLTDNGKAFDQQETPLSVHLAVGGREYVVPVAGDIASQTVPLHGDTTVEFAPLLTQTWLPCSEDEPNCNAPKLKLYAGARLVAEGAVPQDSWKESFLAPSASQSEVQPAARIALYRPDSPDSQSSYSPFGGLSSETMATVSMDLKFVFPPSSSLFLKPKQQASQVENDGQKEFIWTVRDVDPDFEYGFSLKVLVMRAVPHMGNVEMWMNYRRVGDHIMAPIEATAERLTAKCQVRPIDGMPADAYPCSFAHLFTFKNTGDYGIGDQVVVLVEWRQDGVNHEMLSPPFEIIAGQRRLAALGTDTPLWSMTDEDWQAVVDQHHGSCSRKDLHFGFGAGMLMRGVQSVKLPEDFPMIGVERPGVLDTGWKDMLEGFSQGLQEGVDAAKELPPEVCALGLCKGALPGCRSGSANMVHYPDLVFNFNRPFHYSNDSGKTAFTASARATLAYAFSFMPEVIELAIKELNETGHLPGSPNAAPTEAPQSTSGSEADSGAGQGEGDQDWWGSGGAQRGEDRRLMQATGRDLEAHQMRVHFKAPLPFKMDHALLEMMVQRGYFEEVHDEKAHDLGPLRITGFSLVDAGSASDDEPGVPSMWILKEYFKHPKDEAPLTIGARLGSAVGLVLAAGVLAALSLVVAYSVQRPARAPARAANARQPTSYKRVEETSAAD